MDWFYSNFIQGKQKAVVAFIVTTIVAFLVKHGVQLPDNAAQTFQALVWGLIGMVSVFVKRNQ